MSSRPHHVEHHHHAAVGAVDPRRPVVGSEAFSDQSKSSMGVPTTESEVDRCFRDLDCHVDHPRPADRLRLERMGAFERSRVNHRLHRPPSGEQRPLPVARSLGSRPHRRHSPPTRSLGELTDPSSSPTTSANWPTRSSGPHRPAAVARTEIGASLGVTKQAAQKRFVSKLPGGDIGDPDSGFARFTPRPQRDRRRPQRRPRGP